MSEKGQEFFKYLDDRKAAVLSEVKSLAAEDRTDESNILKAKANIYDISKAVFGVAEKAVSEEQLRDEFLKKFGNITGQWEKAYEQAKTHDDSYKILVEEAKLSAVSEIKEKAAELF